MKTAFFSRDWLELLIVSSEGVKWVADFPIDLSLIDETESLMFDNPYSSIVAGKSGAVVHHFLNHGWSSSDKWFHAKDSLTQFLRDTVLIGQLEDLVVLRVFGAFDDRVASADIIGPASRIKELWRNLPNDRSLA
ncbi:MAG: hypothetical protein KF782_21585 [Labilithrix sp.]|nr:hypothetical protein [Labilithrix sp.]